jgi:hypothetical protein
VRDFQWRAPSLAMQNNIVGNHGRRLRRRPIPLRTLSLDSNGNDNNIIIILSII